MKARMVVNSGKLNQLTKRLAQLAAEGPNAYGAALYKMGLDIEKTAKQKCPVDTGFLRASGYTTPPMRGRIRETQVAIGERPSKGTYNTPPEILAVSVSGGNEISVEVGFAAEYAVEVHERTWVEHANGEAKFLQNAVNALEPDFQRRLVEAVERMMRLGIGARLARGYSRGEVEP